jgi:hypothetical protein
MTTMTFSELNDWLVYRLAHEQTSPDFHPLTDFPLVILVGLTGVGKSTLIERLRQQVEFTMLPNRRRITDDLIIGALQQASGETPYPVTDRVKRFEYTARYRARYPGGMAHALRALRVSTAMVHAPLLFDGLRGLNEVQHAAVEFPLSRFVVLDAPDAVRLSRLLKRGDAFDSTSLSNSTTKSSLAAALAAIPGIEMVFSAGQLRQMVGTIQSWGCTTDEVVKKVSIIVEERRNYDSRATREYLAQTLPPKRALVIDTSALPPDAVAKQVKGWLLSRE